jgi:C-terminal processing protease CtpA/Prc
LHKSSKGSLVFFNQFIAVSFDRIERVEPGLAADLAGMRVADYIVFVGSHNVVKMDEEQVLQLIQ